MSREAVLQKVVDELARNGLSGRSLRDIAAAVGTSHRMLIHYFGSRDGMLTAVVEAVEAQQRAIAQQTAVTDELDGLAAIWRRVSQPELWPHERLFFECYARALQGQPPFDTLLPRLVDDWIEPAVAAQVAAGGSADQARARARVGLAVVRGLLLDLLATGDRAGADRAFEEFLRAARLARAAAHDAASS